MGTDVFRVGLTRDTLRDDGTPIFDPGLLELFDRQGVVWEFLPDHVRELTAEHAARYDAICVLRPKVTAATLARADRRLRLVARTGVGYDNVDVEACTANGVILTNTPDGVRRPVATTIVLLVLALTHKLFVKDRITRAGRWAETTNHMGEGLTGKTLGSVGLGNIASEMFRLFAPFGMRHLAVGRSATEAHARSLSVELTDLDTLLRESDIVCLNCPLTPQTRHLIDARAIGLMKPTAYLVNTARGPVVDEPALYRALVEQRIAGAALDVFEQEPVAPDNPILGLDNVIVTPHSICWTDEFFRGNAESAFRAVLAVASGATPTYVVNRDVLRDPRTGVRPRG